MKATTYNTLQEMIVALENTKGHILDDHNTSARGRVVTGVGIVHRGETQIPVSFIDAVAFSLNEIYLDENNVPHVSTNAVSGPIYLSAKGNTLEEAILKYNQEAMENLFASSFISDVHLLVDGKMVPTNLVHVAQVRVMQGMVEKAYVAKYGRGKQYAS